MTLRGLRDENGELFPLRSLAEAKALGLARETRLLLAEFYQRTGK